MRFIVQTGDLRYAHMQVFFYFAGHGARIRQDCGMFGVDGKVLLLNDFFHRYITSKGGPVIAILDCCRDIPEDGVQGTCAPDLVCDASCSLTQGDTEQQTPVRTHHSHLLSRLLLG